MEKRKLTRLEIELIVGVGIFILFAVFYFVAKEKIYNRAYDDGIAKATADCSSKIIQSQSTIVKDAIEKEIIKTESPSKSYDRFNSNFPRKDTSAILGNGRATPSGKPR